MKLNRTILIILILISLFPVSGFSGKGSDINVRIINQGNGKYVSLYEMAKENGFDQSFDPVVQRGKIFYNKHYAVYQIGLSAVLADGKVLRSDLPVVRGKGYAVLIPADIVRDIYAEFFDISTEEKNGYIVASAVTANRSEENKTTPGLTENKPRKESKTEDKIDFIVIDAGHGGKDPGAIGPKGNKEKNLVLSTAQLLAQYLKKSLPGVSVSLTRSTDVFLELGERTEIANKKLGRKRNGLFISIHANASISPKASGYETYFLSRNPSNDDARVTAALENNVIMMEKKGKHKYDDAEFVEALMLTSQIQKESSKLAEMIQKSMEGTLKKSESRGVKKADFFVLRGSLMPAVLVEIGYITNLAEQQQMLSKAYKAKIVKGIGEGVTDFVSNYDAIVTDH